MKERFEGPGRPHLIDALKRHEMVNGLTPLAEALATAGKIEEFAPGQALMAEGGSDNDIYFLVAGLVAVLVKKNNIATRKAGQTVGEMAAIEPAQLRAATVQALDTVVSLKVNNPDFHRIAGDYPVVWQPIARDLARRLYERNRLIEEPNESPRLFIISSVEALDVARAIQKGLERDVLPEVWNEGVFFAGGYALEALETAVDSADFAVAIAQPDDIVTSRSKRSRTLRDNVLFELGLFMGRLTRFRTILVHPRVKLLKLPSDLHGLNLLSYELPTTPADLAVRLGPVCSDIRTLIRQLGVFKREH